MKKFIVSCLMAFVFVVSAFSQSHTSTQSHQAQVTNIATTTKLYTDEGSYFTAGEDGFIIKWSNDGNGEHYQISDVGIKLMALSPNGDDLAVYETDGGSVNRVSVWDWSTLTKKYQKNFADSVTALSFSAKGTYLIIGTATVDGAVFVKCGDWKIIDNKIKANTSIVNYIHTSDSEKTVVFYSPAGFLSYYNLASGSLTKKINIVQGLTQPLMFNNNNFFTGVKDNHIYIINAFKGNTISSISSQNPTILSTSKDDNLYYLEYDGRSSYELKMLENMENLTVSNPRLVKALKGPRGNQALDVGIKIINDIYLGNRKGEIYKIDTEPTISTENFSLLTENTYSKIYDMAPAESDFYFLTSNAVYKSSYDSGLVNQLAVTSGQTQMTVLQDSQILLWSKSTKNPVVLMDLDKRTTTEIFTPKSNLQAVNVFDINGKLMITEIESNSTVNIFDMETNTLKEVYSGTGIQDAVIANNGFVYIAKSAATNPKVPMIKVNLETLETVPVSVKGNVAYALSSDGVNIYGINLVSDENVQNTYVFSYNTVSNTVTNILKFAEEDSEAFTYLNGSNLFTNIGKNKVHCYNLSTKKRFSYNRSASIPLKICQNNNRVVILNNNGSISWCGTQTSTLLADWYLTTDNQWYEF